MSRARILVIDDEDIVRRCCVRALGPEGYEVDVVSDGPSGLSLLGSSGYDIIVTDLKMPGMDGHEVIRRILSVAPNSRIIVITGFDTDQPPHGAYAVLHKPFTPVALLSAISATLRSK